MTARSKRRTRKLAQPTPSNSILMRYFPAWLLLAVVLGIMLPSILTTTLDVTGQLLRAVPTFISSLFDRNETTIAPLFTEEVDYWDAHISRWSAEYGLDPNLLATVMQIESCGHPTVASVAGAQGLFQVMPFHFTTGENFLDPDTNAMRSANFLNQCIGFANGDIGLSLACYNGGPSVTTRPFSQWPNETQRYYRWGMGIYLDAVHNSSYSPTLEQWLSAGGRVLCDRASVELGL